MKGSGDGAEGTKGCRIYNQDNKYNEYWILIGPDILKHIGYYIVFGELVSCISFIVSTVFHNEISISHRTPCVIHQVK